jgi:hypothetical protein
LEDESHHDKHRAQVMIPMPLRLRFLPVAGGRLPVPCMDSLINRHHKDNGGEYRTNNQQKTEQGELEKAKGPCVEKEEQAEV